MKLTRREILEAAVPATLGTVIGTNYPMNKDEQFTEGYKARCRAFGLANQPLGETPNFLARELERLHDRIDELENRR